MTEVTGVPPQTPMKRFLSLTALTALLGGPASAAPVISAQSIIVNPVPTSLSVKVWTDRGSGSQAPSYLPGERIRLFTSVNRDAYVYLFNVGPQGHVDLILPNRLSSSNFLKANTTRAFPSATDPFTFTVAPPYGLNKVLALASLRPLNLDQLSSFKSQQDQFATVNVQGQQQLAQALSIVVRPVEQSSWVTDTAYYTVAAGASGGTAVPLQTPAPTASPGRGTPIQPLPGGERAQALSIQPLPQHRDWQTTVERRGDLADVYAEYAARLRAEGYTQTGIKQAGNHIRGEFRQGSKRATLDVKQKGKRFEVKLSRR